MLVHENHLIRKLYCYRVRRTNTIKNLNEFFSFNPSLQMISSYIYIFLTKNNRVRVNQFYSYSKARLSIFFNSIKKINFLLKGTAK